MIYNALHKSLLLCANQCRHTGPYRLGIHVQAVNVDSFKQSSKINKMYIYSVFRLSTAWLMYFTVRRRISEKTKLLTAFPKILIDFCLFFQPSRTNVTSLQFEQDGDVVTADSDGFITIYSVDSDGAYFVRMEFEVGSILILYSIVC